MPLIATFNGRYRNIPEVSSRCARRVRPRYAIVQVLNNFPSSKERLDLVRGQLKKGKFTYAKDFCSR